jgi:dTDP-4-dehydrorhamnose 3,5-epimerase
VRFTPLSIPDAWLVELEPIVDERGFFARAWCAAEFEEHGLSTGFVQENTGVSSRRGTLRGMHYQRAPHEEVKLVRCVRGAAFDVLVDLRPGSPEYRRWFGVELTQDNHRMLYVPEGCAHGYLTLLDDTEITYKTTHVYVRDASAGVHHADPAIGIEWPIAVDVISAQDAAWPSLDD